MSYSGFFDCLILMIFIVNRKKMDHFRNIFRLLKYFIKFAKPTQEQKVLLILDGHKSHIHNFDTLKLASKKACDNVISATLYKPQATAIRFDIF